MEIKGVFLSTEEHLGQACACCLSILSLTSIGKLCEFLAYLTISLDGIQEDKNIWVVSRCYNAILGKKEIFKEGFMAFRKVEKCGLVWLHRKP